MKRHLLGRYQVIGSCIILVFAGFGPVRAEAAPNPEKVSIPVHVGGKDLNMVAFVYQPPGSGPFPVIVFSHGRSPKVSERAGLDQPILAGHAGYWVKKGFAVLAPIRPGYGETGGDDLEVSGIKISASGECSGSPLYAQVAKNAADTIEADVMWLRHQSWANSKKIILVGQSVGGMTTVAAGARHLSGVIAYINFSGGTGGDPERMPGRSCFPEALTALYGQLGRTTKLPNLWLYAQNDLFWGEAAPKLWHAAFSKAGGTGEFIETAAVPDEDGHKLLAKGGRLWSVHVDAFIETLGFAAAPHD